MSGPVDGHERYGGDGGEHDREHDDDEPRCAIGGLGRGLGNPHGVDEGVRDEVQELHVLL